jgi:hypothetical protein
VKIEMKRTREIAHVLFLAIGLGSFGHFGEIKFSSVMGLNKRGGYSFVKLKKN